MRVDRRGFLVTAGAAVGAAALARPATGSAAGLRALADEARIARLSALPSTRAATRAFGAADWSSARVAVSGEALVPLASRDGLPTLLVVSEPAGGALAAAASRNGDDALFTDDLVVQLLDDAAATVRWSTVDGRKLASWQADGEQRLGVAPALSELGAGLSHPPLALASKLRPLGADPRDGGLLHLAGAHAAAAIRAAAA
jgi:hypothetical protein